MADELAAEARIGPCRNAELEAPGRIRRLKIVAKHTNLLLIRRQKERLADCERPADEIGVMGAFLIPGAQIRPGLAMSQFGVASRLVHPTRLKSLYPASKVIVVSSVGASNLKRSSHQRQQFYTGWLQSMPSVLLSTLRCQEQ